MGRQCGQCGRSTCSWSVSLTYTTYSREEVDGRPLECQQRAVNAPSAVRRQSIRAAHARAPTKHYDCYAYHTAESWSQASWGPGFNSQLGQKVLLGLFVKNFSVPSTSPRFGDEILNGISRNIMSVVPVILSLTFHKLSNGK